MLSIFGKEQFEWRKAGSLTAAGGIGSREVFGNTVQEATSSLDVHREQPVLEEADQKFSWRSGFTKQPSFYVSPEPCFICFTNISVRELSCVFSSVVAAGNSADDNWEKKLEFRANSSQCMWAKCSLLDLCDMKKSDFHSKLLQQTALAKYLCVLYKILFTSCNDTKFAHSWNSTWKRLINFCAAGVSLCFIELYRTSKTSRKIVDLKKIKIEE